MRLSRRTWLRNGCLLAALVLVSGCSKGPAKLSGTVPGSGTVTLDGQPLAGATVAFIPTDSEGKPANGVTDPQGRFTLKTFVSAAEGQANGAMPGDYTVMVTKYEQVSSSTPLEIDTYKQQKALTEAKETGKKMETQGQATLITPLKYSNPKETDLKATVKGSDNQFTFDLKSS